MKRILSFLLAIVMLISVVTGLNVTSSAATRTQSEAIEWIKARGNESWWSDVDGGYGCQCVDLIMAFYQYFGYSRMSGHAYQYMSNHIPAGSNWYYSSSPTPGCVFVKQADNGYYPYGHVGLVYAVSGSTMYTVETNLVSPYDGAQGRANAQFKSHPISFANTFIVPDFQTDTNPPSSNDFKVCELREGAFTVMAHITDPSGIKSVQYAIWTEKNGQDDIIWHDAHCTDGNDYYWARVNFSEHKNEKGTYIIHMYAYDNAGNLTNKGISYTFPTKGPTISDMQISGVSSKGYRVTCTIKAESGLGVSKAQFPTWTSKNGQDDIIWKDGEIKNGSQATFYVSASEHNNEKGPYITHIYAYDAIGNSTSVNAGTVTLTDTPILVDTYTFNNKETIDNLEKMYEWLGLTKPTTYTETTYKVYNSGKTWKEAKQWCESQGGHLAAITSSAEQKQLETVLSNYNGVYCWLGGERVDDKWTWVTGESFSYTNWAEGEPNNGSNGNEKYLGTYGVNKYYFDYKWNDYLNTSKTIGGFVCEFEKKLCLEHSWDEGTITKAVTCTQAGEKTFHCSKCEETYIETIPALGHDYVDVITLPTMQSEGYTTHTCRICSHSFADAKVPALTGSAYYIVPALIRQNTALTLKHADKECTVNAQNGIFETSELSEGDYTVYAKQKNSLRVCLGNYQTQAGEYINNDTITLPLGDVNGDDVINIADISLLLSGENYAMAQETLDLNGDNLITVADIATILQADNYGKTSDLIV